MLICLLRVHFEERLWLRTGSLPDSHLHLPVHLAKVIFTIKAPPWLAKSLERPSKMRVSILGTASFLSPRVERLVMADIFLMARP
jgi:hypothetical protein